MTTLATWIFAAMMLLAPADRLAKLSPDESIAQRTKRYEAIAKDLDEVIEEQGSLFPGPDGKKQTAALMTSVGWYESGFNPRVDDGRQRGDGGRSWCLMQINLGAGRVPVGDDEMKSWRGRDLVKERKKCFRVAHRMLKMSLGACQAKSGGDQLSSYTSGACRDNERKARARWRVMGNLLVRVRQADSSG